jgi:hypothetical protein
MYYCTACQREVGRKEAPRDIQPWVITGLASIAYFAVATASCCMTGGFGLVIVLPAAILLIPFAVIDLCLLFVKPQLICPICSGPVQYNPRLK